jgi:hypothetical protein
MTAPHVSPKPSRKVFLHLGLPPDLAANIALAALHADVLSDDLIIDILRDVFAVPEKDAA